MTQSTCTPNDNVISIFKNKKADHNTWVVSKIDMQSLYKNAQTYMRTNALLSSKDVKNIQRTELRAYEIIFKRIENRCSLSPQGFKILIANIYTRIAKYYRAHASQCDINLFIARQEKLVQILKSTNPELNVAAKAHVKAIRDILRPHQRAKFG